MKKKISKCIVSIGIKWLQWDTFEMYFKEDLLCAHQLASQGDMYDFEIVEKCVFKWIDCIYVCG